MNQGSVTTRIANRVKRLRASKGWSAQRLADECTRIGDGKALTRNTITKIETGHRQAVKVEELTVLARALGVTLDVLTGEDDTSRVLTVLHLSDLRIGSDHLFDGPIEPNTNPDVLGEALYRDIDLLIEETGSRPDLVVVTGDLTNAGMRSEFDVAGSIVHGLLRHLNLTTERLVLVPGSHDVTIAACRAYFDDCEADDIEPQPPYHKKWRHFNRTFTDLYRNVRGVVFDPEQQAWSLFEIAELGLVVCGLNSTMAYSHRPADQYGWLGAEQLKWFDDRLRSYENAGWLRIGAVHHNVLGTAGVAEENLRDAEALDNVLGQRLNLLLGGRIADGAPEIGRLASGLNVLTAGSPAVPDGERATAANQYQLVQVTAEGLTRWVRRYEQTTQEWVAAQRPDAEWPEHVDRAWDAAHQAFPLSTAMMLPTRVDGWAPQADPDAPSDPRLDLLDRVAEVCQVRYSDAQVSRVEGRADRPPYIRITYREEGFEKQVRIGACVGEFDTPEVDAFVARVHAAESDPDAELVCLGSVPDARVRDHARRNGVRLRTFIEFQGLIDLREYVAAQTERLQRDLVYPPAQYVPQRFRDLTGASREIEDGLVDHLMDLLRHDDGRFLLLLGDFGRGKTFALRELARRVPRELPNLVPIFIELRLLDKALPIDGLVAAHLAGHGVEVIDLRAINYMLAQGRIVLIFDGFDELATRVSYDRAADHLDTLLAAAKDRAKIVVASRTQHFQNHQQVRTAMGERVGLLPRRRILAVEDFSRDQIRDHLAKRHGLDSDAANARLELIGSVQELLELARNPRMLTFIADLAVERLQTVVRANRSLSAAELYGEILNTWLAFEEERTEGIPGAPVGLSLADLWRAVTTLALRLWANEATYLGLDDVGEVARTLTDLASGGHLSHAQATHAIGAGSLLVRSENGQFGFIHSSVMEWLVAKEIAGQLAAGGEPRLLFDRTLSELTCDFVCALAEARLIQRWATALLADSSAKSTAKSAAYANALQLSTRLRTPARADLRGASLRGENLSDRELRDVDLTDADLTDARLVRANLSGANLTGARLVGVRLDDAVLDGADLTGADLSNARLLGTSMHGVRITGSNWRRATLVGVRSGGELFGKAELAGAAIAHAQPGEFDLAPAAVGADYGFEYGRLPQPIAYSADCVNLAIGGEDGAVIVCDTSIGAPVRTLHGHTDRVYAVAYSPDGTLLATGSGDGTVRLWDAYSGECLHVLAEHPHWVWPMVFGPDGALLATGSSDGTVRLWDTASGELRHGLTGHAERVWSVAFQPGGDLLAVGDVDGLRLWQLPGGVLRHQASVPGADHSIYWVVFRPGGDLLATGSGDRTVRLWDTATGEERQRLDGHTKPVYTLDFHPDGDLLVSGDTNGGVRMWRRADDWAGHELTEHTGAVYKVVFDATGDLLATGDSDGVVRLWNPANELQVHELSEHRASVWPMVFRPDGTQLATSSNDGTTRLWNLRTGRSQWELRGHGRRTSGVSFSSDGEVLASAANDGTVRLWSPRTGRQLNQLSGVAGRLVSATMSPVGSLLATASYDGDLHMWDAVTGAYQRTISLETDNVWALAFSPDGDIIAAAKDDDTVELRYASTNRPIMSYTEHRGRVRSIAFGPTGGPGADDDGVVVATGCDDTTVRLWNVRRSNSRVVLSGHTQRVYSVSFNGDGALLATASNDGTVRLWDVAEGRAIHTIDAGNRLWSAAFSPTDDLLVTGGDDGLVNLWRATTGEHVHAWHGHHRRVSSAVFSPDGSLVASSGDDGTVRLWSVAGGRAKVVLLGLAGGWAALAPDGRYKSQGDIDGQFWHAIGMSRFEPGELDPYLPAIKNIPVNEDL